MNEGSERKVKPLYGIGGVTLLTVLLVLCLTLFSVLALGSAQADLRLSEKNAQNVRDYYSAENTAFSFIRTAGELWPVGRSRPATDDFIQALAEGFSEIYGIWAYDEGTELVVMAEVPVQGDSFLQIEFSLKSEGNGSRYGIRQWQMVPPPVDEGDIAFLPVFLP